MDRHDTDSNLGSSHFSRIAGAAGLLGIAVHFIVNAVLKVFPPEGASSEILERYFVEQSETWAAVHGLRYVAFVGLALLIAGVYTRVRAKANPTGKGWALFGLLGGTMMLANLMIANGIEMFLFLDFSLLSKNSELFWLIFELTRVLFTAEFVSWAILIAGMSTAGWQSSQLPKWFSVYGLVIAPVALLSNVFFHVVWNDGWAVIFIEIASLGGLIWFLMLSLLLLLHRER